ncbi:MAG: TrbI/VirB10 family protein [Candidatus Obscuribacterales bacterium]|nr:TrbI/VirB10 family protein [Candidatus Obscuribacterales bacterium]
MEEAFETRDRQRPLKVYVTPTERQGWQPVTRSLCAWGLVLSLSTGASQSVWSADTPTEGCGSPVLHGTVIQTECNRPQSPSVNKADVCVVTPGTVLELVLSTEIAADETVEGDQFFGKISKDVLVDGRLVIPKGTVAHGVLSTLEGPKRAGRNGYINARFDYLITPDGREVPIEGNSTTRDSKGTAAAKVVGRAAGYTAIGGVVGTVMVLQYGGLAAAVASHGYDLAGGAAIGGAAGLTIAMLTKGKSVMLQPGAEMHVILSEPLQLPTMNMPDETAEDYSIPGLKVKVAGMRIDRRPCGGVGEITLTLDILNQSENTFSAFDIGLEDERGNVFFPSPIGDTSMWSSKIKPRGHLKNNITFSVDNVKSRHKLVFFKPYSREPLAEFALTDAMLASGKVSSKVH